MLRRFVIKPSGTFVLLLIAVHLLAILSVCLTNLVLWARLGLSVAILVSLFHHLYRHARGTQSWRSFSLDKKSVVVNTLGGNELNGELTHQTVVTPCCVVLCVRLDGYRLPVCQVIFRDAMQVDAFRELRVRLKFT